MAGKILVVDDDPIAVRLMRLSLTNEGFQVSTAASASEGLRVAQTERPDLVILDIMMPDMDGVEMCRLLRTQKATADIPIIFLTAKTQLDDKVIGLRAGADDYITKPADPREVVARVETVLARTRRATAVKPGRVIALIGAKGGVGTSTVAVNLGAELARHQASTLLLDLHHHAGTAAWHLKLTAPRFSLADLLALQAEQVDTRQVEKALTTHSSGLRVLPSPPAGANLGELPAAHASAIVRSAVPLVDFVLLDLPHMLSEASQEVLRASDMALIVLAPDPMTVACAEQTVSLLESAGVGSEMIALVVVNRVQSAVSLSLGEIERRLQKGCLAAVPPALEEMAFADRQGMPLALSESQSMAAIALREMAERVQSRVSGHAQQLR